MLRLRLLGLPSLRVADRQVTLGVSKSVALLAWLAVEGATPRARLASLLWPDLDAVKARRNLRRELARLKEAGTGDVVSARNDVLELAAGVRVDVAECDSDECDDSRRLELLSGTFCDGLDPPGAPEAAAWLDDQRARFATLRGRAHERLAETHEAAGDNRAALVHVDALLRADPLQERHHRAAMRLHAALGEREAALACYQRCRALLRDELGLAPLAETEALAASLHGGSAPDVAEPAGAAANGSIEGGVAAGSASPAADVLPPTLPFVGRNAEAAALESTWHAQRTMLVCGPGGRGKTRLAHDFAASKGPFATVACHHGDSGLAYASVTRALRMLVAAAGAPEPAWLREELARLLPELGAAPPPFTDDTGKLRFFEACAQAWVALGQLSFAVVVIDDLHLADAASAELVGYLIGRLHDLAGERADVPRLLATLRRDEASGALDEALAVAVRTGAAQRIELEPLAAADVFELVLRLSGAARPERFARRLHGATAGNAFFIHETLRHLVASGDLRRDASGVWSTAFDEATADYRELPVPASVHDAIVARVGRCGEATRRVLEAASLAEEPFDARILAGTTALDDLETAEALERAEAAQLVASAGTGLRFAHDLIRQSLAAQIGVARRSLLHERLAASAEARGDAPARIARHWQAAGNALRARPFWQSAGERAERAFADADAVAFHASVVEARDDDALALRSWRALAALHRRGEHAPEALAAAASATALARRLGDETLAAECAIDAALLRLDFGQAAEAQAAIEAHLAAGLPTPELARRADLVRARVLLQLGRAEEARRAARDVLARGAGGSERAAVLDFLALAGYRAGDIDDALRCAIAARDACAALNDDAGCGTAEMRIGVCRIVQGHPEAGRRHLEEARAVAAARRDINAERLVIVNLIKLHVDVGDADGVLALAERGWQLSPRFARPDIEQKLLEAFMHAHHLRGDLGAALDFAGRVHAKAIGNGALVNRQQAALALAELHARLGDAAGALGFLDAADRDAAAADFLGLKVRLSRVMVLLLAGESAAARRLLDGLGPAAAMALPHDRQAVIALDAALQVAEGRPGDALAQLLTMDEAASEELASARLAVALRAWTRLPAPARAAHDVGAMLELAGTMLRRGRLPALEALELRSDLAGALAAAGRSDEAAEEREALGCLCDRLAASLVGHPGQRQRFLALHATASA